MEQLTDFERDQLAEVINIGGGNASIALSQMVGKKVMIDIPDMFIGKVEEAIKFLGGSEKVITVIILKLLGDVSGSVILILTPESALKLARILTSKLNRNIEILDELGRSALREVGNIVSGAGVTALAKFLDMNILQSVPGITTDMLGSTIDALLAEVKAKSDAVMVFKVNFEIEGERIEGQLFFLFDPVTTEKILKATKEKLSF